jgi:mycothiol synthase
MEGDESMTKLQTQEPLLESSLSLRATKWADVDAVAQLIYDVCEADGDVTVAVTPEELNNQWHSKGFNPETDTCVVETSDGRIVGYGEFINEKDHAHLGSDVYAHHQYEREIILAALMMYVEARAHEEMKLAAPDLRVFIRSTMDGKDVAAKKLHEAAGFVPVRFNWRMEINLTQAPPDANWPEGIELHPFVREEQSQIVLDAVNEAFRDHWGSHDTSFEDWERGRFDRSDFDPSLWVIAWDGAEVAGFSLNRYRMGIGWVSTLGVRRPWRKKGLGLALLQHSFGEFYKRGMTTIGLGVDASNPTGATRLYQGAGMYIASEFITYDKVLRSTMELAK